jgi:hypothetical protein
MKHVSDLAMTHRINTATRPSVQGKLQKEGKRWNKVC